MSNPRVAQALDRIQRDLQRLTTHVKSYSGIPPRDAVVIENDAMAIAELAAILVKEARLAQGHPPRSAERVVGNVRKAIGYTYR
jgi:hypothetical protein